jgi:hypothetical protein
MRSLSYFSIVVIKYHGQKQSAEERAYFSLQFSDHIASLREVRAGTQGGNLEAGTEAEAMEEDCPLLMGEDYLLHGENCPLLMGDSMQG